MESPIKALKEFKFTKAFWKRTIIALIGVLIMGITIGIMQAVDAGTDPYSKMCYGIALKMQKYNKIEWLSFLEIYGNVSLALNGVAFVILVFINWKLFGVGTILNMVVVGYAADFTRWVLGKAGFDAMNDSTAAVIAITIVSLVLFMIGVGLYIDAGLGTSPYDAIPNLLHQTINKHSKKNVPYKLVRIPFDLFFAIVALILCGFSVGMTVTFAMAFFLGPIVDMVAKLLAKFVRFEE